VDNNIFASPVSVWEMSQGGAYVHNLIAGIVRPSQEKGRYTPYHLPHSTEVAGLSIILNGDARFYNNIFAPVNPNEKWNYGLAKYDETGYPNFIDGNVYYNKAVQFGAEKNFVAQPDFDPKFKIEEKGDEVYVSFAVQGLSGLQTETVTTGRLGKAKFPKAAYENPDGAPIIFDKDYLDVKRSERPTPGPFERLKEGDNIIKVW
jgi:hypothetical protein